MTEVLPAMSAPTRAVPVDEFALRADHDESRPVGSGTGPA